MFDIHQTCLDEYGELDGTLSDDYASGLLEEFANSFEGQTLLGPDGSPGWAGLLLDLYFDHIGAMFPEISINDVREILFDLFPRKVSVEPECAPEIVAELHAFWTFLGRQYALAQAPRILALLHLHDDTIARLKTELANPGNFGLAKSMVMGGMKAGFDMSQQDEMEKFVGLYNDSLPLTMPSFSEPRETPKKEARKKKKAQRQARKRNRR